MVKLQLNERLGNVMFQYALARIIADGLNCTLLTICQQFNVQLERNFPNAPLNISRRDKYLYNSPAIYLSHKWNHSLPQYDIASIIQSRPKYVAINGFFESYKNLEPYSPQIREMYYRKVNKHNSLCIHLRLGDVADIAREIPEYIDFAIELALQYPQLPVDLVVETPTDEFAEFSFKRLKAAIGDRARMVWHDNPIESFDYLTGSSVLLGSESTFGWWAGFLSKSQVYIALSDKQRFVFRQKERYLEMSPPNFTIYNLDTKEYLVRGLHGL